MSETIKKLPFIPLRGMTVFPNMVVSFSLGRQKSIDSLEKAMQTDDTVFLTAQKDASELNPDYKQLYEMGTIAHVKQVLRLPGNMAHVIVEGLTRAKVVEFLEESTYTIAQVQEIEQDAENFVSDDKTEALMRAAADLFEEYSQINTKSSNVEGVVNIANASRPGQIADIIAAGMFLKLQTKQEILELVSPIERLKKVLSILNHELDILKLKKEIEEKVKSHIDQTQKEYYLREQMKVIQEELGDKDGVGADCEKWLKMIEKKGMPDDIRNTLEKEIERFSKIPVTSPESNILRSYIEYVIELPWSKQTKESFDIKKAQKILDKDHYGLEKVKERILEFLAVRENTNSLHGPIICLVGPPGVGKTSIAKSIAKALNRNYVRMSLGGVKDEAEIRGHRRTYIGAMPGRIIKAMKQARTMNPLMLLDEVDKLSTSVNGDPASALLEVLDGEQNSTFRDHYIELPYDLSKVLFICTANRLDTIQPALRDRMEIIHLSSYTSEEKKNIAIQHLYPKQLKLHGLKKNQLKISENGFQAIIDSYTREAGVRTLERVIGQLCRKTVKMILSDEKKFVSIKESNLEQYLGIKKYHYDKMEEKPQIGVVRGLAWTQAGGDTLCIEVNAMKGDGKFELTGNMGDVMKESAKAAISFIRSQTTQLHISDDFYKQTDIHIHIPEGAVPKDGPSAGITMATAMISALTKIPVRNDVAMTGEITIRGRVLPIGGLKEKLLAAKRAGVSTVVLPIENKRDLFEVPDSIKNAMKLVFATEMEDVLTNALVGGFPDGSK